MQSSKSEADSISRIRIPLVWVAFILVALSAISAQAGRQEVIIDTDIGDDVDDAFALALAVKSPELEILGVTTTFGDTETRARIVDRFLGEVGCTGIPVLAGLRPRRRLRCRRDATRWAGTGRSRRTAMRWNLSSIRSASIRARLR